MVMRDMQYSMDIIERHDNKSDGLWNKANRRGNHIKRLERHVNTNFDDFVDDNTDIEDDDYKNISMRHGDRFQKYRGQTDDGFRRDGQFVQKNTFNDFRNCDDVDGDLGTIKMKIFVFQEKKQSRDLLRVGEEDWANFLLSPLFQRK